MTELAHSRFATAAWTMAIDRVTAEVVTEFERRGIDCLVFKGPVLADWLYDADGGRFYGDSDVLVSPAELAHARETLRELGFRRPLTEADHAIVGKPDIYAWERHGRWVDLQVELAGLQAPAAAQWRALWAGRDRWTVAGEPVWTFGPDARTMLLATHAAHHGAGTPQPVCDLERGLARAGDALWRRAWALARELDGAGAFAAGLGILPEGERLARRIGIDVAIARHTRLRASGASHVALSIDELLTTPGARARLRIVRDEVAPSADFLRWWLPLARRGSRGLLAARLWRPIWLAGQLPAAVASWMRLLRRPDRRAGAETPRVDDDLTVRQ